MQSAAVAVQEVNGWSSHMIPRLIDGSTCDTRDLVPRLWTVSEVAEFLRVNDCGAYADCFVAKVLYTCLISFNLENCTTSL